MKKREVVSIDIEELFPIIEWEIRKNFPHLPEGTEFIYTSKTTFITFDVIRPDEYNKKQMEG